MHVAAAALLVNILALAAPLFIMNVYDRVVPNGAIASLIALSIGLLIAVVFDFVLRTVRSRIIDTTGKMLDVVLAAKIYEHALAVKMNQPSSGTILKSAGRNQGHGRWRVFRTRLCFIQRHRPLRGGSSEFCERRCPASHSHAGFVDFKPVLSRKGLCDFFRDLKIGPPSLSVAGLCARLDQPSRISYQHRLIRRC